VQSQRKGGQKPREGTPSVKKKGGSKGGKASTKGKKKNFLGNKQKPNKTNVTAEGNGLSGRCKGVA